MFILKTCETKIIQLGNVSKSHSQITGLFYRIFGLALQFFIC